jgi:exopolysaccharide biosynthesis polyprenyl glycosylphosphotransferase
LKRISTLLPTIISDLLAHSFAWFLFYLVKFKLGWFDTTDSPQPVMLLIPSLILGLYWVLIYAIFGMYNNLFLISRLDEIIRTAKISIIGTLILFFFLFIDQLNWDASNINYAKYYAMIYWFLVFLTTSMFRFVVRTAQKRKTRSGKGLHRAIIVGTGKNAVEVSENLNRNKILGLDVVGFVQTGGEINEHLTKPILGFIDDIRSLVVEKKIDDVIVALEQTESRKLIEVVDQVDLPDVSVKILPDFYQIIIGLNRTNQIFGLPLIDIMPDPMPSWEKITKRAFDISVSVILLLIVAPIMALLYVIIPLSSTGKAIYSQERVGLFGKSFIIYKFRTMVSDAEKSGSPQLATQNDPRITPLGNFMRKTRLDELPQLWNVIRGDMSLVGPRPERPFFVNQFKKQIPLYSRRLRVRPGITGWAQVKWKYDESFEDVVEKTKYDLFYVENMSLRMDFKILVNTIATVILGKGQ